MDPGAGQEWRASAELSTTHGVATDCEVRIRDRPALPGVGPCKSGLCVRRTSRGDRLRSGSGSSLIAWSKALPAARRGVDGPPSSASPSRCGVRSALKASLASRGRSEGRLSMAMTSSGALPRSGGAGVQAPNRLPLDGDLRVHREHVGGPVTSQVTRWLRPRRQPGAPTREGLPSAARPPRWAVRRAGLPPLDA